MTWKYRHVAEFRTVIAEETLASSKASRINTFVVIWKRVERTAWEISDDIGCFQKHGF